MGWSRGRRLAQAGFDTGIESEARSTTDDFNSSDSHKLLALLLSADIGIALLQVHEYFGRH